MKLVSCSYIPRLSPRTHIYLTIEPAFKDQNSRRERAWEQGYVSCTFTTILLNSSNSFIPTTSSVAEALTDARPSDVEHV